MTLTLGTVSMLSMAGDYNYKPGLWESTATMKMEGMPPEMAAMAMMNMEPKVERECVKGTEHLFEDNQECKYEKKRISSKKMQIVKITCVTDGNVVTTGRGEINFMGETVEGWFEMDMPNAPPEMKMKSTFTSKYIGACK